jgi:hypothetical protein
VVPGGRNNGSPPENSPRLQWPGEDPEDDTGLRIVAQADKFAPNLGTLLY